MKTTITKYRVHTVTREIDTEGNLIREVEGWQEFADKNEAEAFAEGATVEKVVEEINIDDDFKPLPAPIED